jgi:prephenate dehydrogenase
METPIDRVGIIGFGPMGQFMADKMFDGCEIVAHDPGVTEKKIGNVALVDIDTALNTDVTVLAVPTAVLHEVADTILFSPSLDNSPLLVDISSVKMYPTAVFDRFLPNHQDLLLCHPLFGPESAAKSLDGHRLIVTGSHGEKATHLTDRWRRLGLNILEMSAEEHDRQMAMVQAVPFLFGRLATELAMDDSPSLQTRSRLAVRKLEWLDGVHSPELFQSAIEFNPFAIEMVARLQEEITRLRQATEDSGNKDLIAQTSRVLETVRE